MRDTMLKLYIKLQSLMDRDEGQDLVEYALVVAILALGATATMTTLSGTVSGAFTTIGTKLSGAL